MSSAWRYDDGAESWVNRVCPKHIPYCVWQMIEVFAGNGAAHEFLLLMIASDRDMSDSVVQNDQVLLPGMGSDAPTFQLVRTMMSGDTSREHFVETQIEAYNRLLAAHAGSSYRSRWNVPTLRGTRDIHVAGSAGAKWHVPRDTCTWPPEHSSPSERTTQGWRIE